MSIPKVMSEGDLLLNKYATTPRDTNQVTMDTSKLQHIYSSNDQSHAVTSVVVVEGGKVWSNQMFSHPSDAWMYIGLLLHNKYQAEEYSVGSVPGTYWTRDETGIDVFETRLERRFYQWKPTMTKETVATIWTRSENVISDDRVVLSMFGLSTPPFGVTFPVVWSFKAAPVSSAP